MRVVNHILFKVVKECVFRDWIKYENKTVIIVEVEDCGTEYILLSLQLQLGT